MAICIWLGSLDIFGTMSPFLAFQLKFVVAYIGQFGANNAVVMGLMAGG